jgi:hypothetical protein
MRFYLLIFLITASGCQSGAPYRSAMAEQCMSTNPTHFEMLTDSQLRECGVWLNSRGRGMAMSRTRQKLDDMPTCIDIGNGLINCPDNGNQTFQIIR